MLYEEVITNSFEVPVIMGHIPSLCGSSFEFYAELHLNTRCLRNW